MTAAQSHVLLRLAECRTGALGGRVHRCARCGDEQILYNSCRDRHCPTCLAPRSAEWLEERQGELLPTHYFHVVFTLPKEVAALALANKRVVYGILFKSAVKTLRKLAGARLGLQVGGLAVLHTWSQTLEHHPHVHCVVVGGGPSLDGARWVKSRPRFFLPVRVVSRYYRGAFLRALERARARGKLEFGRATTGLDDDRQWARWMAAVRRHEWVVYSKPPFGSPERVLKYLARYTHRVALSNHRLVAMTEETVSFRYRDRRNADAQRTMTLAAPEFLRRFLLHVLPRGFVRIRHFGFLAIRNRSDNIARCRELLGVPATWAPAPEPDACGHGDRARPAEGATKLPAGRACPKCGGQDWWLEPLPPPSSSGRAVEPRDTS
ncbi:IS91 family transposase [Myxococcota bacterium]|nr:IS91 family transposase [Myxococcota bacterium]